VEAEADWFLEDLNKGMVAVVLIADKVLRWDLKGCLESELSRECLIVE